MNSNTKLLPCPFCGSGVNLSEFGGITSIVCAAGDACSGSKLIVAYPSEDYETALFAWNTRAAPAEDVSVVVEEPVAWIRAAAKKWFYESFDDDLLAKMEQHKIIAQAEGFSVSVMAELQLEMEQAYHSHPQRPVVLPDRKYDNRETTPHASGWNSCLDAVEELNKC